MYSTLMEYADEKKGRPKAAPAPPVGERPSRARRPYLPGPGAPVHPAMAGLTAEFGMGSGDPRLPGRAREGRSRPVAGPKALPGATPEGRIARVEGAVSSPTPGSLSGKSERRARPIGTARLNASRRLQLRPVNPVVYRGPYRRENSSRRRLPA